MFTMKNIEHNVILIQWCPVLRVHLLKTVPLTFIHAYSSELTLVLSCSLKYLAKVCALIVPTMSSVTTVMQCLSVAKQPTFVQHSLYHV